ncbi:MAG: type III ribulose-bisphosphate carboxylase [Candidatus Komeilibacteria bacterium]
MYSQFNFYKFTKPFNPEKHIIAKFYFDAPSLSWREAVHAIAGESSIGTWTKIARLSKAQYKKLAPKIIGEDRRKHMVKIAYPLALFEEGNIPQLLSSIAGNIFSMKVVEHLRLEDIEFPKSYIKSMPGPRFGIDGLRRLLNIQGRPLVGSIVKPKVGLTAKQHANACYQLWKNGVDVVKDDENLTDQDFNHFRERVREVLKMRRRVEKETGQKKMAIINITAPYNEALKRAKYIKAHGGFCMMVDIIAMGWSAIQSLRQENLGLVMHGHRAGHSMFSRLPEHGMSMLVVAKLARLAGIDELHTGTVVGKMDGDSKVVTELDDFLKEDWAHFDNLRSDWSSIKPVMPVASGGLQPGMIPNVVKYIGQEVIINFGGGIFGHPQGVAAGARAAHQALQATLAGISLTKAAQEHKELATALKYWQE